MQAYTEAEVAALVGEVLGKTVVYTELSLAQLGDAMKANGLPDWMAQTMLALEQVKANGWAEATSPHVAEITGREPESLADFLRAHRAQLRG